jgi:hypothetical protein
MGLLVLLIFGMIFGAIGASMATKRHRNELAWGLICLLFGIFGIFILALLGDQESR